MLGQKIKSLAIWQIHNLDIVTIKGSNKLIKDFDLSDLERIKVIVDIVIARSQRTDYFYIANYVVVGQINAEK